MDRNGIAALACVGCGLILHACGGRDRSPTTREDGQSKTAQTSALETGSKILQTTAPVKQLDVYLVGFHPLKDHPAVQMEAHHYCSQMNEDFAQCALFDGNTNSAHLTGVEYIISEKLFGKLPAAERQYWHPHNYEILSGQLVAPGLPETAEKILLKQKMNSYGKTWHLWMSGADNGGDALPLGPPHLAWSFNYDGEVRPDLLQNRDRTMDIDTSKKRRDRQDLAPAAHPQQGADALKGKFTASSGSQRAQADRREDGK
jgi:Protein of unknown function (DUF1264)